MWDVIYRWNDDGSFVIEGKTERKANHAHSMECCSLRYCRAAQQVSVDARARVVAWSDLRCATQALLTEKAGPLNVQYIFLGWLSIFPAERASLGSPPFLLLSPAVFIRYVSKPCEQR